MINTTLQERKDIVTKFVVKNEFNPINHYGVIYKIFSNIDHRVYIGKTRRFSERAMEHVRASLDENYDNRSSKFLYQNIRKLGLDNFHMEIIDTAESPEELSDKEIRYIIKFKSILPEYGYNTTVDRLKYIYNEKSRHNRSKSHEGLLDSASSRRRKSNPLYAFNINDGIMIYSESGKLLGDVVLDNTDRAVVSRAAKYCNIIDNFYILYSHKGRVIQKIESLNQEISKCHDRELQVVLFNYLYLYEMIYHEDSTNIKKLFKTYALLYSDSNLKRYKYHKIDTIPY